MKYVAEESAPSPKDDRWGPVDWLKLALVPVLLLMVAGVWAQVRFQQDPALGVQAAQEMGWDEGESLAVGAANSEAPQSFSGEGEQRTPPFQLNAQSYQTSVNVGGDCFYAFDLRHLDGSLAAGLDRAEASNLYGIEPGEYYLEVTTGPAPGCPWSVSLTPR